MPIAFSLPLAILAGVLVIQDQPRNIWPSQYSSRPAEEMAAQFENEARPVFRHRHDIIRLMELREGQVVAEIGAGSGFLSRLVAREIGPKGLAIATELDPKMIAYMNNRAATEGLANFRAIKGAENSTGLGRNSTDVVVVVNTYSFFDQPQQMLHSIAASLKSGGLLLIVDFPRNAGEGVDPGDVERTAAHAGFQRIDTSTTVPGHFAIRFRKR